MVPVNVVMNILVAQNASKILGSREADSIASQEGLCSIELLSAYLRSTRFNFQTILLSAHTVNVCVPYGSQNKNYYFPYLSNPFSRSFVSRHFALMADPSGHAV